MQRFDRRQHPQCPHIPCSFKVFITVSSGPNARAEQAEMDDVIPWWRQNFIEEFGALASDVVVENSEDVNFTGGTEADRKLTKERGHAIREISRRIVGCGHHIANVPTRAESTALAAEQQCTDAGILCFAERQPQIDEVCFSDRIEALGCIEHDFGHGPADGQVNRHGFS
jgi:hypothetical protein